MKQISNETRKTYHWVLGLQITNDAYKLKSKLDFVPRIFSFFWPLLTEISYYFRICFYVKTWISRDLNLKLNGCLGTMSYVGLSVKGKIIRPTLLFGVWKICWNIFHLTRPVFDYFQSKILDVVSSFPEFARGCKKSVYFIFTFFRYNQYYSPVTRVVSAIFNDTRNTAFKINWQMYINLYQHAKKLGYLTIFL